ncbi:MAG: Uma2 family endonuclease [Polyangiaceae bacterium]
MTSAAGFIPLRTSAPRSRVEWELEDGDSVPVSPSHNDAVDELSSVFKAWISDAGRHASVEHDVAVRWDPANPKVGVDPDLAIFEPPPAHRDELTSVMTWREGQSPPLLAVEVVSPSNPRKDYAVSPEKYAANGAQELWVFDPRLVGPRSTGGPFRLQVWNRAADGAFERTYAGPGPARSTVLDAWIVPAQEGRRLRVSGDSEGRSLWPTREERLLAEKESAVAEKESALAEIAALKAELARRPK